MNCEWAKSIVYELWMGEKYCKWIVNGLKSIVYELWMCEKHCIWIVNVWKALYMNCEWAKTVNGRKALYMNCECAKSILKSCKYNSMTVVL